MNKFILSLLFILLVVGGGVYLVSRGGGPSSQENEEGVVCTMEVKMCPDGSYVGRTGPQCEFKECPDSPLSSHADIIKVSSPFADDVVVSPLVVTGEARGNWYFEASFPVRLYDANGKELAVTPAQAQGEWMTTEFVPFSATLTFETPVTATGTLVLEKDNPSGMPEFDDKISVPVRFSQ